VSVTGPVVVLAGGTGGAKLARGMLDVVGGDELVVVANTGDDVEIYGAYVSPDPDLITLWLADRIDDRGWGLKGDTFNVMEGLRELGVDVWFNLGDRDLALGIERQRALATGSTLTDAHSALTRALGVSARVLPMSDQPVRTRVMAQGRWWAFQEFMIKGGGQGPVQEVEFHGTGNARPTDQVLDALAAARAIVVGPSNPIISIGPILALSGLRDALSASPASVVAVSPLVGGAVVKGPTEPFMQWTGQPLTSTGIANLYAGVIDGLVADEPTDSVPVRQTDVLMADAEGRARVAADALEFALELRASRPAS
jgi:LPPG:FO 2-phospho-L-lactate transferase